jgi:hypothetical protein
MRRDRGGSMRRDPTYLMPATYLMCHHDQRDAEARRVTAYQGIFRLRFFVSPKLETPLTNRDSLRKTKGRTSTKRMHSSVYLPPPPLDIISTY